MSSPKAMTHGACDRRRRPYYLIKLRARNTKAALARQTSRGKELLTMTAKQFGLALSMAVLAVSAAAQTTVTTSGTTTSGTVPVFNGPATVTNSPLTVSGSNVGIGTPSPSAALDVSGVGSGTLGAIRAISGASFTALDPNFGLMLNRSTGYVNNNAVNGSIQFRLANAAAYDTTVMTLLPSGRVGIGTTGPLSPLSVSGQTVIGTPYKGDASLHITHAYGGYGRFTQMSPDGPSLNALNLMGSTDSANNATWFSWGVNNGSWTISPGTNFGTGFTVNASGNVGVGTTGPAAALDVAASAAGSVANNLIIRNQAAPYAGGLQGSSISFIVDPGFQPTYPTAAIRAYENTQGQSNGAGDLAFLTFNNAGSTTEKMRITYNGNVGIGTASPASLLSVGSSSQFQVNSAGAVSSGQIVSSGPVGIGVNPQYTLDVNGQIHASQAIYASGGITFSDGSSLTSANTLCGGDYAESVDVTGDRTQYEPGDVLVIDTAASGKFLKSAEPYSTAVTGIYSTKPGAVGRRQSTPKSDAEVPMAMIGIVPTKVSAENGPIHRGDLLVSSSSIGYAMKGTDRSRLTGAVIGKALDNLESGKGLIEVVVTLQ
jgi:hypothetical protein